MTDNILKSLVTEAVSLDREINEKADRLKELKAELVAEARSRENELAPTDEAVGVGLQKAGTAALSASTSPRRRSRRDRRGRESHRKIQDLAGGVFTRLFVPAISYRPVQRFREEAAVLPPKADANSLIKLCQSASAPRVSFETTEREAA